jgi:phosphoglucosamine mutase
MPQMGTSCIQGTSDDEMTPDAALNIGETIGMQYKDVTVGSDLRPSSAMIRSALIAGLTAAGADVRDTGFVPIPVMPFASNGTECSIMIGNPERRNCISGLTFLNINGTFFSDSQMFALGNRLHDEKLLPAYNSVGNIRYVTGSIDKYRHAVLNTVGHSDCQVAIDCASDSASMVAPQVITDIGSDALTVNCHIDGRSPGRDPSPDEINLKTLTKVVKENFGSIGIALNGDGSRLAAIDENGGYVNGSKLFVLFAKYLQPKTLAMPVDTSMAVRDVLKGDVFMTKVGASHVGETVKNNGLEMGGCNNGTFVFPQISYATDGIAAAAFLSKIASEASLSDAVNDLPVYYRQTATVRYNADREAIAKKISTHTGDIDYDKIYEIDGWRVEMKDGWFLVRFSDVGKLIEITVEGRDKAYTASLMEITKMLVDNSMHISI